MIKTFYVWSGTLRGVQVDAHTALEAVELAVRGNLPCVLNQDIRVSRRPRGHDGMDQYIQAPYEDIFPELFNGDLDVQVAKVTH